MTKAKDGGIVWCGTSGKVIVTVCVLLFLKTSCIVLDTIKYIVRVFLNSKISNFENLYHISLCFSHELLSLFENHLKIDSWKECFS